jgi:surface antigen
MITQATSKVKHYFKSLKSNVEDNYKNGKHWKVFGPKM